jgi:hypothetical protein
MRAPKRVREQRAEFPDHLVKEMEEVSAMWQFGGKQTKEYLAAAVALNQKLRAAGFDALCVIER